MPDFTPRLNLPRPLADRSEVADFTIVRDLATALDVVVPFLEGTGAGRPAAATSGRLYRVTDVPGRWDLDGGAAAGWTTLRKPAKLVDDASFPASPQNGDEIIYRPPTVNHDGEPPDWNFRYEAATNRWRFTGGASIQVVAQTGIGQQLGFTQNVQLINGTPDRWRIPRAGAYRVDISFMAKYPFSSGFDRMAQFYVGLVDGANAFVSSLLAGIVMFPQFQPNLPDQAWAGRDVELSPGAARKFVVGYRANFVDAGIIDLAIMAIKPSWLSPVALP